MLRVLPGVVDRYWNRNCSLVSSWKISIIGETFVVGVNVIERMVVEVRSVIEVRVVIHKWRPICASVVPAVPIRRLKAIAILCEDSKTYVKAVERKRNTEKQKRRCSSALMFHQH